MSDDYNFSGGFGGDGITLKGTAGKELTNKQQNNISKMKEILGDPLKTQDWIKYLNEGKKNGGIISKGHGKVMSHKIKHTKII